MRTREIDQLIVALTVATGVEHVFDGSLTERGAGPIRYVVAIQGRRFLAWQDTDSGETVISPVELWDRDNFADAIDDYVLELIATPSRSHAGSLDVKL